MTEKTRKRINKCFWGALEVLGFVAGAFFISGRNIFGPKKELPDLLDFTDR